MIDLKDLREKTEAKIIVIADKNGNVINSYKSDYSNNLSSTSKAVFDMCNGLLQDITGSHLKQLIARCPENYYIVNKSKNSEVIFVASDNNSKLGFIMKYMNSL